MDNNGIINLIRLANEMDNNNAYGMGDLLDYILSTLHNKQNVRYAQTSAQLLDWSNQSPFRLFGLNPSDPNVNQKLRQAYVKWTLQYHPDRSYNVENYVHDPNLSYDENIAARSSKSLREAYQIGKHAYDEIGQYLRNPRYKIKTFSGKPASAFAPTPVASKPTPVPVPEPEPEASTGPRSWERGKYTGNYKFEARNPSMMADLRVKLQAQIEKLWPRLLPIIEKQGFKFGLEWCTKALAAANPYIDAVLIGTTIGEILNQIPVVQQAQQQAGNWVANKFMESPTVRSNAQTSGNAQTSQLSNYYLSQLSTAIKKKGTPFATAYQTFRQQLVQSGGTQQDLSMFDAESNRFRNYQVPGRTTPAPQQAQPYAQYYANNQTLISQILSRVRDIWLPQQQGSGQPATAAALRLHLNGNNNPQVRQVAEQVVNQARQQRLVA